ncbi:unnamed protein product, partial [Candidula unifasciata]
VCEKSGQVAFLTTKERELFPVKTSKDRFGNELCPLKGAPHRGPGCYDNDKKTNLVHLLETKIMSTKGYTLAARTGPRLAKEVAFQTPCPTEYQRHYHDPKNSQESKKPFQTGADRFTMSKKDIINAVPGAGTYEHQIHLNRKVQWHQSFGGSPVFLPTVALRSTIDRNTEKLYSTKEEKKYQRKLAYLKLYY